uniref:Uncharacterized protein n=1 Tax=Oryza glumipatula TaxID=40148 RepID=A0A0E0BFN9_9ORYZ
MLWIISLSETLGAILVFFRVSYVALVAAACTQLVGPITGVSVAYLDTFYVAGMVGYAVAEYRMRRGIEECPSAVAAMPPLISQEQERNREVNVFYAAFMFGLVSLVTVGRMAWLVFFSNGGGGRISSVLEELSVETCFVSFQWTAFVALPLSLVSFNALFCWGAICYVAWHVLGAILGALVGSVAIEVLFFWLAAVAMAGFFGYCLAVHARCKRKDRSRCVKIGKTTIHVTVQTDSNLLHEITSNGPHPIPSSSFSPPPCARNCARAHKPLSFLPPPPLSPELLRRLRRPALLLAGGAAPAPVPARPL